MHDASLAEVVQCAQNFLKCFCVRWCTYTYDVIDLGVAEVLLDAEQLLERPSAEVLHDEVVVLGVLEELQYAAHLGALKLT